MDFGSDPEPDADAQNDEAAAIAEGSGTGGAAGGDPDVLNAAPVALPLAETGSEDGDVIGQLSATDDDLDSLTFALAADGGPTHGTVVISEDGSFIYTPEANYSGNDSFGYQVSDGQGGFDTATVDLSIAPVADAPQVTVADVAVTVAADGGQTVLGDGGDNTLTGGSGTDTLQGLAGNDTLNGEPPTPTFGAKTSGLDISAVLGDLDGSESLQVTVTGLPPGAFLSAGTDQGGGTWILTAGNLVGLSITTPANFATDFSLAISAVAIDTGPGGPVTSAPVSGSIEVTFTLPPGGDDILIGGAGDDTLTGGAGNDTLMFATGDGFDTVTDFTAGTGLGDRIDLTGVAAISNFSALQAAATQDGADTVLSFGGGEGMRLLNVLPGELSADDFVFSGVNNAPVAGDDGTPLPIAGSEDGVVTILASDLLANDSDADLNALSLFSVGGAVGGSVARNGQGNVVFTPTANHSGPASFTYTVSDGQGGFDTATVDLSIAPVADAPQVTVADVAVAIPGLAGQTITGTSGNNTLTGTLEGDDVFNGGTGFDRILGGAGDDSIGIRGPFSAASSVEQIDGGAGINVVRGTTGNDTLDFSATALINVARIEGGIGGDTITGSVGDDTLVGGAGNDILRGGGGADTFVISGTTDGDDTFNGGDGIDRILGSGLDDTIGIRGPFNTASSIEQIDGGAGVNVVRGTTGSDTLDFSATTLLNIARIEGGNGNDNVTGSLGDDTIVGGSGNDVLRGGDGVDTFVVSGATDGDDTFNGGDGFDRILGSNLDDTIGIRGPFNAASSIQQIDGGAGVNVVRGTTGSDTLDFSATTLLNIARIEGGNGNDTITGSLDADTIAGGNGNDVIRGGGGDDIFTVSGIAEGDDRFFGDAGDDRILGSAGDDTIGIKGPFNAANSVEQIDGGGGINIVRGTSGSDVLDFSSTTLLNIDHIAGGNGNDAITGSQNGDTIAGGSGSDTMRGGGGDDTFIVTGSTEGDDTFFGDAGVDRIQGSAGDDTIGIKGPFNAANSIEEIDGGAGFNILRGTTANDTLDFSVTTLLNVAEIRGGSGDDVLIGSAGSDTFAVSGATDGFDSYFGGDGFDRIVGGGSDDVIGLKGTFNAARSIAEIDGGAGNDIVRGSSGSDSLDFSATTLVNIARVEGGSGNDTIIGSVANDTIVGGIGTDSLRGGGGDDIFSFMAGDGSDRILDFQLGDILRFEALPEAGITIQQQGAHAVVHFAASNVQVTLENTNAADIGYSLSDQPGDEALIVQFN